MTAMHKGGLGSASLVLSSGATVDALVAVNPLGSPVTPSGRHFWAAPFEMAQEFGGLGPDPAPGHVAVPPSLKAQAMARHGRGSDPNPSGNTTIAIVATDMALDKAQCHRMAVAACPFTGATAPNCPAAVAVVAALAVRALMIGRRLW